MYKWLAVMMAALMLMAFVPACDDDDDDPVVTVTAPSDLTASDITETSVTISWTDNSDNEDGFSLEMKIGADGTFAEIADLGADVVETTLNGLDNTNVYYFRVVAYQGDIMSDYTSDLMVELLQAQSSFSFVPDYTEQTVANDVTFYGFHDIALTNNLDEENILVLEFLGETYPDNWMTSMCIGDQCFSPNVRTRNDTIAAGESHEIDVDFFPNDAGTGSVWFKISKLSDPADCDSVLFTVTKEQ